MRKLWNLLFADHNKRMAEIKAQIKESERQEKRIKAAYALYRDVYFNYGPAWATRMTDPETIIQDDKAITVINYLEI